MTARAYATIVLVATVAATAAVAALNAMVDPTAQLGTGLLDPVAEGPRDRVAKVELLRARFEPGAADPPGDLVVLGSSRTKKLDPQWLGAGDSGLNAAVVGGDLFEARVFAAWLASLGDAAPGAASQRYPQLVVGIDVEQLRDSSLQGSGFLDVPAVADVARREAAGSDGSLASELDRLERLLLTWQVTKASAASLRARLRDDAGASTADGDGGGGAAAATLDEFTGAGVPVDDARWFDAQAAARRSRDTPSRIESSIGELRATYEANGARLDEDAVADLRALVRTVRDADGPTPILYLTPAHPAAIRQLGPLGRDARRDAVWSLLREIEHDGLARVVDCTHCIDDASQSWIDATHPSPLGMRQLARRLAGELERS